MLEYKNNPNSNIVEVAVVGKITAKNLEQVAAQMKADIEKHGHIRVLEEFHSFEGMDPIALWKDAKFGLNHMDKITHVAVIADAKWVQTLASAVGNIFSAKVKVFEHSQAETAKQWLETAPEPNQNSKLEYKSSSDSNVVELVIEGKITESDFDRVIDQFKADLKKHGKLRILEDIRSFEGMDPMALWKDLQQVRLVNDISHVALVADQKWMRTLAEAAGSIVSAEIKSFESSELAAARTWLATA
ncbi:STAS/SEC14 domain-containing protein [Romeria aff. gracilis LEGE 07310]|uniref:STAS/SEC14 domain-containing protein n=1 Tax=Vasconcelosia minhoensis LEGE 07310 TaxID=915328 RepID=A0A8J7DS26_9CYAN|nr:STAS/SEC14 domain-containing protein [Romeria gracilis]MBE9079639.1 STAS/SEC14 domain-containing protein [Romeria aff. gracilis LEGE 07310]